MKHKPENNALRLLYWARRVFFEVEVESKDLENGLTTSKKDHPADNEHQSSDDGYSDTTASNVVRVL